MIFTNKNITHDICCISPCGPPTVMLNLFLNYKASIKKLQFGTEKSRIQETLNLLTDADSSKVLFWRVSHKKIGAWNSSCDPKANKRTKNLYPMAQNHTQNNTQTTGNSMT